MEVFFYKFSKYPNSTKLPSDDQKIIFTGRLRDNSSIINPIISFQEINGNIDRNYAYIPEFNRYYFVTDWVYNPPLWVAHMKVDVLASYKTEIGNANEYVLRSSYTSDGTITDRNYPATTVENIIVNTGSITPAWAAETLTEGTYVVGVLSAGINYYLMDITALQEFLTWVASDDAAEELVGDFQTAFPELKAVANLKQYINSIMWIPGKHIGGGSEVITLGWVSTPNTYDVVPANGIVTFTSNVAIPKHPQSSTRGSYLNFSPFSTYTLFYPPWGLINISSFDIGGATTLVLSVDVDYRCGTGTLSLIVNGKEIGRYYSQVGVPCLFNVIMQSSTGLGEVLSNTATMATQALSLNFLGAGQTALNAIEDMAEKLIPQSYSSGSMGSFAALKGNIELRGRFLEIVSEDNEHMGRPLCQKVVLNTIPGFIMTAGPDIAIDATENELNEIRTMMKEGFYFE